MSILSAMMVVMAVVPGLPTLPFMTLGVITGMLAYVLHKQAPTLTEALNGGAISATGKSVGDKAGAQGAATPDAKAPEKLETLLNLDTLQIELGYGLVCLADKRKGGDLLDRVTGVRRNFAQDMGVLIPPIRLRDNLQLGPNEYRFLLKGQSIAQGQLMPGYFLAMNATNSKTPLKGIPTVEPVFQLPATWITEVERKTAEISGHTIVDAPSVLVTHLSESIRRCAHDILCRQDVQALLDNLKQTNPTVVNELIPNMLTVGQIQRILQNLLAEGISVRNLAGILEKVSDYAPLTKNPDELSEFARRALGSQITKPYQMDSGKLRAITIDPRLEQQLAQGVRQSANEMAMILDPRLARHIIDTLGRSIQQMLSAGHPPVILCSPQIRLPFRRFFETTYSDLAVISYAEVPPRVEVQNAAVIPFIEAMPVAA
jgi:flagellar biosynthesis protein FlhA